MTLFAMVDDLQYELDRGSVSLLLLLDLSGAFDTINYSILLISLPGMHLGALSCWVQFFLEERTQKVVLGDFCSTPWPLICGVPSGFFLSCYLTFT